MKHFLFFALALAIVSAPAVQAQVYDCATAGGVNCSAAIPDSNGTTDGVLISTFTVGSVAACAGSIPTTVVPNVDVSHSWVGDLTLTLTGPDATSSTLVNRPIAGTGSCASDDIVTSFQDAAAPFGCTPTAPANGVSPIAPETPLAAFATATLTGTWTLQINDAANSSIGSLNSWGVSFVCGPVPTVTITTIDNVGSENGEPIVFQITRSSLIPPGPLTVNVSFSGTATNGVDYTAVVPVTIPTGQLSTTLTVTPLADPAFEPTETVVATIAPGTGYVVGTPASATGFIFGVPETIPTLSPLAMIAAAMLLAGAALIAMRSGING